MYTEKTATAQGPNGTAMSKFKGQALESNDLQQIKGGNDGSTPPPDDEDTGIVIHENVGDL